MDIKRNKIDADERINEELFLKQYFHDDSQKKELKDEKIEATETGKPALYDYTLERDFMNFTKGSNAFSGLNRLGMFAKPNQSKEDAVKAEENINKKEPEPKKP